MQASLKEHFLKFGGHPGYQSMREHQDLVLVS